MIMTDDTAELLLNLIDKLTAENKRLSDQRAALLESCQELLEGVDDYWASTELGSDIVSMAQGNIAKANGEQP